MEKLPTALIRYIFTFFDDAVTCYLAHRMRWLRTALPLQPAMLMAQDVLEAAGRSGDTWLLDAQLPRVQPGGIDWTAVALTADSAGHCAIIDKLPAADICWRELARETKSPEWMAIYLARTEEGYSGFADLIEYMALEGWEPRALIPAIENHVAIHGGPPAIKDRHQALYLARLAWVRGNDGLAKMLGGCEGALCCVRTTPASTFPAVVENFAESAKPGCGLNCGLSCVTEREDAELLRQVITAAPHAITSAPNSVKCKSCITSIDSFRTILDLDNKSFYVIVDGIKAWNEIYVAAVCWRKPEKARIAKTQAGNDWMPAWLWAVANRQTLAGQLALALGVEDIQEAAFGAYNVDDRLFQLALCRLSEEQLNDMLEHPGATDMDSNSEHIREMHAARPRTPCPAPP